VERETTRHALRLERERHAEEAETGRLRIERDHELNRLRVEGELALQETRERSRHETALLGLERDRARAVMDNEQTPAAIQARLIARLPDILSRLPKPDELRTVTVNGADQTSLAGLLTQLAAVIGALRAAAGEAPSVTGGAAPEGNGQAGR
jgi:hypothetical protein